MDAAGVEGQRMIDIATGVDETGALWRRDDVTQTLNPVVDGYAMEAGQKRAVAARMNIERSARTEGTREARRAIAELETAARPRNDGLLDPRVRRSDADMHAKLHSGRDYSTGYQGNATPKLVERDHNQAQLKRAPDPHNLHLNDPVPAGNSAYEHAQQRRAKEIEDLQIRVTRIEQWLWSWSAQR